MPATDFQSPVATPAEVFRNVESPLFAAAVVAVAAFLWCFLWWGFSGSPPLWQARAVVPKEKDARITPQSSGRRMFSFINSVYGKQHANEGTVRVAAALKEIRFLWNMIYKNLMANVLLERCCLGQNAGQQLAEIAASIFQVA
jgi:hypothetical protein